MAAFRRSGKLTNGSAVHFGFDELERCLTGRIRPSFISECRLSIEGGVARQKSEDKRSAILEAATRVFAERGLGAATSAISGAAGIAEGTLFTYFETKDALVNALYRELKLEMAAEMMAGFPRGESVRTRLEHVWNQYVEWGRRNPLRQRTLKQVEVWNGLTKESKKAASAPFAELEKMIEEAERERIVQDLPRRFVEATMGALAETVIELARQDPQRAKVYQKAGFEMLWGGIAEKAVAPASAKSGR